MRKYQQLVLLLLCSFSIVILLAYRSENNRLKYVLQAVNFFGRNDAAVLKQIDNATRHIHLDFTYPLAIWQMIGTSFHAYAAYWLRNELVAGGDALVLVAGKRGAVINFKCGFFYEDATHSVIGKFRFTRLEHNSENEASEFTIYKFFCRLNRDFGTPEKVFFTDLISSEKYTKSIQLRKLKNEGEKTKATICLNLLDFNRTTPYGKVKKNLEQFFVSHRAWGINNFLVYNSEMLPHNIELILERSDVSVHQLPFNFPFSNVNSSYNLQKLIETDCILRNTNRATYTTMLAADEFLYSSFNVHDIGTKLNKEEKRYEVPSFDVCIEEKNKLLLNNLYYNPENSKARSVFVYRLPLTLQETLSDPKDLNIAKMTISNVMVHHYTQCDKIGADGLRLWRSMLHGEFIKNLNLVQYRVSLLIED